MELKKAYMELDMPLINYIFLFAVPMCVMGYVIQHVLISLFPYLLPAIKYLIYSIPIYCILVVFIYPVAKFQTRKIEIDQNIHLFITRMGVLSTSKLNRKLLFKVLSENKEYGALSDEIDKIYFLIEYWNFNLAQAARYVADRTPSIILKDFLNRLAHSLDAGEDFKTFVSKEQEVVMNQYATMYEGSLTKLDILRELYVSLIIAALFMMILVALMPMFTQGNITPLLYGSIILFMFVELIMVYFVRANMPRDQMWHDLPTRPEVDKKLKFALPITLIISIGLAFTLFNLISNVAIIVALAALPLIIPGLIIQREEEAVKRCDESYDAFTRAIGSSVETVGGTIEDAIKKILLHDFGPLTIHISILYNRLKSRIDKKKAWYHFSAATGSNLIAKFSDMHSTGLGIGGDSIEVGKITSNNFIRIHNLRRLRYQSADTLKGMLYGLSVAITLTLYLVLNVMKLMNQTFMSIDLAEAEDLQFPLLSFKFNIGLITFLVIIVILSHAVISSTMVRVVSGGHKLSPILTFLGLLWIGIICALLSDALMGPLLGV